MIAAAVGVDLRRAAEFAHPDDRASCRASRAAFRSSISVAQAGSSTLAQLLDRVEVVGVRVPAEDLVVDAAQRDFDERHAALDQPPGQQAALAEAIAAVASRRRRGLLVQVEGLGRGAAASDATARS